MNDTQNEKLAQITPETLVIGIDIAKNKHVARAIDDRGFEFGKRITFTNDREGFEKLLRWVEEHQADHQKTHVMVGMEPTGHYWFSLADYLDSCGHQLVLVNPSHVKRLKEIDDHSPSKNDTKDAMVIAKQVKDGRYSVPNLLEGIYAELREGIKLRDQLVQLKNQTEGRVQNWLHRYFPEFEQVFKDWDGVSALATLRTFPLPQAIAETTPEAIVDTWKAYAKRHAGFARAQKLHEAAEKSVGITAGLRFAHQELEALLDQYELYTRQLETLEAQLTEQLEHLPGAEQMRDIKGLGDMTIAAFFAEVGDIHQYRHPKQLISLAGLDLKENSSGVYKGQTTISKRGRSRLRRILFLAIRPLVNHNDTFRALHHELTQRSDRPLTKMQSLIALCGKLLKVLFVIGQRECPFDGAKLLQDRKCSQTQAA
ncbi:IS110 family transposase [Salicibibacter cibarius]|uniref:IS110 family transposase n=1 Tax=Salicibibacter cibarius TaxID=2743000 RepID=A0A7T6Z3C8_9BACI|nr:IS110 family transposase [Salicibibacter cibarius]QQK76258.1 IS110 family transposase [Salicibibacter cibarius]